MLENITFPEKLSPLFLPKRFKVLFGGRSAGRSWGCARALLLLGSGNVPGMALAPPLRVLCAREFQNSITESVHRVLVDQIDNMGMNYLYEVQRDHIYGREGTPAAGTSFSFEGIKNNTSRIKSYEGIDVCWVEEAVKTSQASWGILIPTIRKEESEIWMTFNPELETDYTYVRFVLEADPASTTVIRMTYRDNPWLPKVIIEEIERDKQDRPDYYLNVWEGHCLQNLEGAVYAKELRRAQEGGRLTKVPWDPEWPVNTAWDLGRADATAIWFWQQIAMQTRIIGYWQVTGGDIPDILGEFQRRRYVFGDHYLPHDARHHRFGYKHSIEEIVRKAYPERVNIVPKMRLSDGINAARMFFPRCWFDEEECADGLRALRHYRFKVVDGQLSSEPLHDWASDGADGFRYLAVSASRFRARSALEDRIDRIEVQTRGTGVLEGARRAAASSLGWLR